MTHGSGKDDMSNNWTIAKAELAIKNIDRNKNNKILNFIFGSPLLEIKHVIHWFCETSNHRSMVRFHVYSYSKHCARTVGRRYTYLSDLILDSYAVLKKIAGRQTGYV